MGVVAALGRMCLSVIFILAAGNKILNWQGTEQGVVAAATDLLHYFGVGSFAHGALQFFLPQIPFFLVLATAFELVGGVFLFLGIKVRFASFLLLLLLIPATLLFHHFWFLEGADRELQMTMFLKNISIFGGLLITLAYGKGNFRSKTALGSSSN